MAHPPRLVTIDGETRSIQEWSRQHGVPATTIASRIDHLGWTAADAVRTPIDKRFARGGKHKRGLPRPAPRLRQHRSTRQAFAEWLVNGERFIRYFGPWGSVRARDAYRQFCAEWHTGQTRRVPTARPGATVHVAELIDAYLADIDSDPTRFRKFGRRTSEYHLQRAALRVLNESAGTLSVRDFDSVALQACMRAMVKRGWARKTTNEHRARIVGVFRWGVGRKMVPGEVAAELATVPRLKRGAGGAEVGRKQPVPVDALRKTLSRLDRPYSVMVRLQRLVGCRPVEICGMRGSDIDRRAGEWKWTVPDVDNKNAHREQQQVYWLGPRAQRLLRPILDAGATGYLFQTRQQTKSGRHVTPAMYRDAIADACRLAGVPVWTPHRLRHTRAAEVRRRYESSAAAAAAIGDSEEVAREIYTDDDAERQLVKRRIARELG